MLWPCDKLATCAGCHPVQHPLWPCSTREAVNMEGGMDGWTEGGMDGNKNCDEPVQSSSLMSYNCSRVVFLWGRSGERVTLSLLRLIKERTITVICVSLLHSAFLIKNSDEHHCFVSHLGLCFSTYPCVFSLPSIGYDAYFRVRWLFIIWTFTSQLWAVTVKAQIIKKKKNSFPNIFVTSRK